MCSWWPRSAARVRRVGAHGRRTSRGPAPQAEEPALPQSPTSVAAVREMGWEELQYVFAWSFVDELEAVENRGGRAALRERVEQLSEDERCALRVTLV